MHKALKNVYIFLKKQTNKQKPKQNKQETLQKKKKTYNKDVFFKKKIYSGKKVFNTYFTVIQKAIGSQHCNLLLETFFYIGRLQ